VIRKSDPSDDWWRVDSTMPVITRGMVAFFSPDRSTRKRRPEKTGCSSTVGANSRISTVR